jgi:penicillin-binding protein 1A
MMTLLRAVTAHGTGAAAAQLNHPLGGKTGTTSDYTDAWFIGFSPSVTCGVWVGFDSRQSLGEKETGAKAALPIWMTFMKQAIAGKDNEQFLVDSSDPGSLKASATIPPRATRAHPPTAPAATPPTSANPSHAPSSALAAPTSKPKPAPAVKPALRPATTSPIQTRPPRNQPSHQSNQLSHPSSL